MANWVRDFLTQHPELAGLPSKVDRHSIHHNTGGNDWVGNFVGKPCHYLSGSEWLPLDTALLTRGDGSMGAPGVPVTIGSDGTVSIDGGTYSQKTSRVGLFTPSTMSFGSKFTVPLGSVNDDSLIASGTIGGAAWQRVLRLTEDGIREELTLQTKPTGLGANAGDWLVLETRLAGVSFPDGWLSDFTADSMQFPLPSAWDVAGNQADCRRYARAVGGAQYLYTGIPVSWLANAVYPITIDPDFASGTSDGYIEGNATSSGIAHSTSTSSNNSGTTFLAGQYKFNISQWYVRRGFLLFDTSSIAGGTVTQVNLKLTATADNTADRDFDLRIVKYDWSAWASDLANTTNRETAYDGCLSAAADNSIWRNTNGMALNTQYASGNLATTWVSPSGTTYYGLLSGYDQDNYSAVGQEYITLAAQEHATAAYRPVLTVAYSGGSSVSIPVILHHLRQQGIS